MLPQAFSVDDGRVLRLTERAPRKGGQAEVFQARLADRLVAVKVYSRTTARADAERRILDDIARDDPSAPDWLVTVLGEGTVNGRPFLVLPWVEASLGDWMEGRTLAERVEALTSATEAVARLHRSRRDLTGYRVHRDIKPDNLLISWEGRWVVRLADLGAAKDGESMAHTANTGVLTEHFAPPEQALPVEQEPRESWDVHALAVTIYWGLTERFPIPALDAPGLLNGDGRRLVHLARRQHQQAWNDEERAEFNRLRRHRPEDLLDLDTATGWREDDSAHLRRALDDVGIDPALAAPMEQALRGALEADWRRRDNDVRRLLSALRGWGKVLGPAPAPRPTVQAASPREATISLSAIPDEPPVRPARRRFPVWIGAALALFVGVGLFAAVAVVWGVAFWSAAGGGQTTSDGDDVPGVEDRATGPSGVPTQEPLAASAAAAPSSTSLPVDAPEPVPSEAASPRGARSSSTSRPNPALAPAPVGEQTVADPVREQTVADPVREPTLAAPVREQAVEDAHREPASAPVTYDLLVAACPADRSVSATVEGATFPLDGYGVTFPSIAAGTHEVTWTAADGRRATQTVVVPRKGRVCQSFAAPGTCRGTCREYSE